MHVTIYGNCQSGPLGLILKRMMPEIEYTRTMPVQAIPINQRAEFLAGLECFDIVIHQPIGGGFVVSMDELKKLAPMKSYISFPSIFFRGFAPQLVSLTHPNGGPIRGPLKDYSLLHRGR
jgi:hypothetical protein